MAVSKYNPCPTVAIEKEVFSDCVRYYIEGSGNLSESSLKLTYDKPIYIYIEGNFDTIENGCFRNSRIVSVMFAKNGSCKHIADNCFISTKLEQITLPETLESIGHNNFRGDITSFNIPSKVMSFSADNLEHCHKLTTITVSEGNTFYKVLDGVLYNCDLTVAIFCPNAMSGSVILPNTVKHIGEYCFKGCKKLKKVIIPPSVETIGDYAFSNSSFDKLVIPNSVKTIGYGCFEMAVIGEYLRLSSQIHNLPDKSFNASDIKKLIFSFGGVTEIGRNALGSFRRSIIPSFVSFESLTKLGVYALNFCNRTAVFEFFSCLDMIDENAFCNTKDNVKLRYFSFCPIRLPEKAFQGLSDNATLIVPKGSRMIFQNAAPWSAIPNICECELDVDYDENDNEVAISDETHFKRLMSVENSKNKADRYFLKEIIEELCLNYLNVDSDEEYKEALEVIKYNRSFSPVIIPELEQKMCQNWTNKYKLKLISRSVFGNNPLSPVTMVHEEPELSLPAADTLLLPKMDVLHLFPETPTASTLVIFNEDIHKQLQILLALAKRSLKIAVSWFTNYSLFKQVKEMAINGIKVQLITNNDLVNNGGYCLNFNELINAGVDISLIEYPHLLHHKFCIIDECLVVNGSYNWTRFSAKNYENITIIRNDEDVVEAFNDEFENLLQNAEHKHIKEMPEFVPDRPEYDRSAFRQYVTEELDAEARETSEERDKITALQKAVSLNPEYLQKINPETKKNYAEEFRTLKESVSMQNTIAAMVDEIPQPQLQIGTTAPRINSSCSTATTQTPTTPSVQHPATVVTRTTRQAVEKIKASGLLMVLDVSGSMDNTYKEGHVHNISKKALAASLAITDSKEVSLWTFGYNARFIDNVGIDSISKIDQVCCKNEGTVLKNFVETADSSINDNALVIIFTDDDSNSIAAAIQAMQKRSNVFWQIIVYGVSHKCISESISNVDNTSVVSLTEYASKTEEQIRQVLLRDYIAWKKKQK